jgi:transcriptional regulator with XRE-family HTH domain
VADEAGYGATVAKRRLSSRLVALRLRSGLSLNEASDKLGWSRGRLNRFEANQWRQPDPSHVRDLARIYAATAREHEELEDLVTRARARLWWHEPEKEAHKVFANEFPGFENDASRISVYMPLVLPGLLQTRAYMDALLAVGHCTPAWQQRAITARLRRQQILERTNGTAPHLVAVVTEACLLYRWGTPEDRAAQLDHLMQIASRPNVELRLISFADGPHPGMSSLIDIFDFPEATDPSVVYLENDTQITEVTKPAEVRAYQDTFTRIREAALTPAATTTYLTQLAQEVSQQ